MTEDMTFSEALNLIKPAGDLTCQIESYDEIIGDLEPLLYKHWVELAAFPEIPLEPDLDFYRRANQMGAIRAYTARLDGKLIAYAVLTIIPHHPHYKSQPFAISDIILVLPEHRNHRVGTALFRCFEADLKGFVISISTKNSAPALQMLAASRGYEAISTDYAKRN